MGGFKNCGKSYLMMNDAELNVSILIATAGVI
jgi:hypothetical protein